jgi:cobalt-zinc-cadmium efflux system outer membrane protein
MQMLAPRKLCTIALTLTGCALAFAQPISLETAWQRALSATPEGLVWEEERAAIDGTVDQAGRLPNPVLDTELENFGARRPYRGFDDGELTVRLRQDIVRRQKRVVARRAAAAAGPVAEAEYKIRIADLRERVANAYNALFVAQEQAALAEDAVALAMRIAQSTQRLHAAGQATGVEVSRANLEIASARSKASAAAKALEAAQKALVAQWVGGPDEDLAAVSVVTPSSLGAPWAGDLEMLQAKLDASPEIQLFDAEAERRRAETEVEKQRSTRDIGLSAGVRFLRKDENATAVVGIEVPLFVHNRYDSAVAAARARARQVEHQKLSATIRLKADLSSRFATLASARNEIQTLESNVLPAAVEVVQRSQAAFDQGQATFLQLLEAQRALLDTREQRLAALQQFLEASVAIERLLGNVI